MPRQENPSDRRHRSLHRHVRVHLRHWSREADGRERHLDGFVLAVAEGAGPGLAVVQVLLGAVLHCDDAVEGLEAAPQLQVHFTLDVHEDQAACEANSHHYQLGPKGPLQHTWEHTHTQLLLVTLLSV